MLWLGFCGWSPITIMEIRIGRSANTVRKFFLIHASRLFTECFNFCTAKVAMSFCDLHWHDVLLGFWSAYFETTCWIGAALIFIYSLPAFKLWLIQFFFLFFTEVEHRQRTFWSKVSMCKCIHSVIQCKMVVVLVISDLKFQTACHILPIKASKKKQ